VLFFLLLWRAKEFILLSRAKGIIFAGRWVFIGISDLCANDQAAVYLIKSSTAEVLKKVHAETESLPTEMSEVGFKA